MPDLAISTRLGTRRAPMNKHLKIELDDATSKLVERQLETGNFDSAEDVIRAA